MHIGIRDRLQAVMQAGAVLQTVGANLLAFIIAVTTNPVAG
jgi:hypothetical protein